MSLFESYLKSIGEVGKAISIRGTLVYCSGLLGARIGEKIIFKKDQVGVVNSISANFVEVMLLSNQSVDLGTMGVRCGENLMANVSEEALGRVIDVFGEPIDGLGFFKKKFKKHLEGTAPAMIDRVRINQNLETGVTLVDLLIPLGKGQRQLIIGDQKTGKTAFLLQVIARQAKLGTICIYAAIGKKKSDLSASIEKLKKLGVMDRTIVLAAPASLPSSLIYLAPFSAMTIAEFFKDNGQNTLVILDEISRHAKYYRELSILSRKMPGRDGYPGDIFYLHSHLLERAGRFLIEDAKDDKIPIRSSKTINQSIVGPKANGLLSKNRSQKTNDSSLEETLSFNVVGKTASITCLPVVETLGSDFTGYIQTNLMSMTDGHLFFDMNKFQEGNRPAVNVGLSVTRVGKQTQTTIERELAFQVREILFEYNKAQNVAKFGVELLEATQQQIVKGEKLNAIFDQANDVVVPKALQLLFIDLLLSDFWALTDPAGIKRHKAYILAAYESGKLNELVTDLENAISNGLIRKFSLLVAQNSQMIAKICDGEG